MCLVHGTDIVIKSTTKELKNIPFIKKKTHKKYNNRCKNKNKKHENLSIQWGGRRQHLLSHQKVPLTTQLATHPPTDPPTYTR